MTNLVLQLFHANLGGHSTTLDGGEFIADYGDVGAEHRAFRDSAGLIDLSSRGRLVLAGGDRLKLLNGQVTNNVRDLKPGEGCYAALVNAKAKMLGDLNILALAGELLLDFEPGRTPGIATRLEQFVIADDVQVIDVAPLYGLLSVQGPRSERVIESLGLFPSVPATELGNVVAKDGSLGELCLVRHARLGGRGFDLFVPNSSLEPAAHRLLGAVREAGGRAAGWTAFDIARVEAGVPRYGVDMDETNLPPEAGIDERAISYTKGCYSGQEVIARIRTYGQVAKALRGLQLSPTLSELPLKGTKLFRNGKDAGYVTSCVRSPALGKPIALGYVRRESNQPGTELNVGGPESGVRAEVVALPFVGREFA